MDPQRGDLICFSHVRWNDVYQRPQHLMSRWAHHRRVFYFEDPELYEHGAGLHVRRCPTSGVYVCTPLLPRSLDAEALTQAQAAHLDALVEHFHLRHPIAWYYHPRPLAFAARVPASLCVYDCMVEAVHAWAEEALLGRADLVFTAGYGLYDAKRGRHARMRAFPDSVEIEHFRRARSVGQEPSDQESIAQPRLGYFGTIDDGLDMKLIVEVARLRPQWQIVLVGPVRIPEVVLATFPQNIHLLGKKGYELLPLYLSGWDVAILPLVHSEATRLLSPTQTPEYLAGGKPVVATSLAEVVRTYGESGLALIADTPSDFVAAVEECLREDPRTRIARADAFLRPLSWDRTFEEMRGLVEASLKPPPLPFTSLGTGA